MSDNKLRFNVYSCKPILIITPLIHKVDKCYYCKRKLTEFTDIEFYNQHDREFIHGKACIDCDAIYASDKIPEGVINGINLKFGKDILIQHIEIVKEYNCDVRTTRVQKFSHGKNKAILPSRRSKPRSM